MSTKLLNNNKKVTLALMIVAMLMSCLLSELSADALADEEGKSLITRMASKTPNSNSLVYIVAYHPNGGTGQTKEVPVESGNEYTIESQGYINSHMIFKCWSTRPEGRGEFYFNGDVIKVTKDITLFAVWSKVF